MYAFFILAILVALIQEQAVASEPMKIMPGDLVEFGEWNNCSQVLDFFERNHGPVNPPYAYGYTSEKGVDSEDYYDSAVFWCKRNEHGKDKFFLTFRFKNSDHELAKCSFQIEFEDFPDGVAVYRDRSMTLRGFMYLKDSKRKVPSHLKLKHNAIKVGNGVSALFYCLNGEWLVLSRD